MNLALPRPRVLVVDDSPVYRKLIEQVLESEPYTLAFAKDGNEALQLIRKHAPSIVVTDWMMPDVSGIELCLKIRADKSRPYTYVILMTSNTQKADVVAGLRAGADDLLTKPFDPSEMRARIRVGRRIIELNCQLAEKNRLLEEAALTDSLTGLLNRRALEEWAVKQLQGATRHGFYFWVGMCDIDSFKTVNDTFGHEAGDKVLCAFAETLKKSLGCSEVCGRLGGDEFLFVLTHLPPEDIERTVDQLREEFARKSFSFAGQTVRVTASFGIVGLQSHDRQQLSLLMRHADQMLYEAKRNGRNCIRKMLLPANECSPALLPPR